MDDTPKVDPHAAKLGVRLTLIVVAVILVAVPFGILLLEVLFNGPLTRADQHIVQTGEHVSRQRRSSGTVNERTIDAVPTTKISPIADVEYVRGETRGRHGRVPGLGSPPRTLRRAAYPDPGILVSEGQLEGNCT